MTMQVSVKNAEVKGSNNCLKIERKCTKTGVVQGLARILYPQMEENFYLYKNAEGGTELVLNEVKIDPEAQI